MTAGQDLARASSLLAQANGYLNLRTARRQVRRADVRHVLDLMREAERLLRGVDAYRLAAVLSGLGEAGMTMAGPAKLPARPGLSLSPVPGGKVTPNGVRLANVAVIQPGDRDVYKLHSTPTFDDRNGAGSLGRIHTPFKK